MDTTNNHEQPEDPPPDSGNDGMADAEMEVDVPETPADEEPGRFGPSPQPSTTPPEVPVAETDPLASETGGQQNDGPQGEDEDGGGPSVSKGETPPPKPPSGTAKPKPATPEPATKPAASEPPETVFNNAELGARAMKEVVVPSVLAVIVSEKVVGKTGVKAALEKLMEEAGSPADPVERCLLEQYFLAHYRLARLQAEAAASQNLAAMKVYNSAANRLLAEFRRLGLSIKAYRQPSSPRSFSVIHQQNVATAGGQQDVKYVDDKGTAKAASPASAPPVATAPPKEAGAEEDLHALRERIARENKQGAKKPVPAGKASSGPGKDPSSS